jgi:hypothetical protein
MSPEPKDALWVSARDAVLISAAETQDSLPSTQD